jgi:hypothetical protein
MTLPWVVLGVAAGKRARGLQAARARLGLAPALIVEWRDWLAVPQRLDEALDQALQVPPDTRCRLKIEPPGDDPQAHAQLLRLGCEQLGRPDCGPPEHGELRATDAWFAGFAAALQRLQAQLDAWPGLHVLNPPRDILAMTDKLHCQRHLQAHGVPTPLLLGTVGGYDEFVALLDRLHGAGRACRAFLKARYGSSAAGVVAYRRNGRGQEQATTSARLVAGPGGPRLFNVKQPRSYHRGADIRQVADGVAAQGAYAELWVPKPRSGPGHYDLRVLTLGARAAHRVARIGRRTLTNLHLDSQRADPAELLGPQDQQLLEATAEQAARAFAASHIIGFDLVVQRGCARVLEANAFGDLLPGLLWQGRDTYAAALQEDAG